MPSDLNFTELEVDLVSNFDDPENTWMSHDGKTIVVYTGRKAVASDGTTFTTKDLDEGTHCRTESRYESSGLFLTPDEVQAIEGSRGRLLNAAMNITNDPYIQLCADPDTADHEKRHSLPDSGDSNPKPNWALHNLRRARTRQFVPSTEGPGKHSLAIRGRFTYSTERGFERIATASKLDKVTSAATATFASLTQWASG
jgi:hypothetical protein